MRHVDQLIQNQVKLLLNEKVYQSFKDNQKPGDPWPKNNVGLWPSNVQYIQQYLEKIRASKFNIGSNSVGLSTYPLYVLNWRTETYWFYPNKELYSVGGAKFGRDLGYDVKADKLNIYADSENMDETTLQGYYTWNGTDLTWHPLAKKEDDPKHTFANNAHEILDWIGFIPGIGEVADAVNAIWYFVEGKVLEGCLSLISLVPVVGSVIGAAGKTALKGISKIGKISDKMGEVVAAIVKYLNPTKGQMMDLAKGLDTIAEKIASSKTLSKYIPQKNIDDVLDALRGGSSKLDELIDTAKAGAEASAGVVKAAEKGTTVTSTLAKSGILGNTQINKWVRSISSLTFERSAKETASLISKLPIVGANSFLRKATTVSVSPKKAAAVVESLQRTFLKNLMKDPDKMLVIIRTSKEIPTEVAEAFAKKGNDILTSSVRNGNLMRIRKMGESITFTQGGTRITKNLADLNRSELKSILAAGSNTNISVAIKNINELNTKYLREIMPDGDDLKRAAGSMGKHAIDNDNPIWNSLLSDPVSKLKTLFPVGSFGNFMNHFSAAANDARKWLDIVYNEVAAAASDTVLADRIPGLAENDPARQSLIYDAVESKMKEYTPGIHSSIKTTIGKKGIISKLGPNVGVPVDNLDLYDPNKSK